MWTFIATSLAADPVYTVSFEERNAHRLHVRAELTGTGPTPLRMATWTPGSYLIREFSRHVERVRATSANGEALTVTRTAKNRWEVQSNGPFTLDYDLYAHAANVRENWVDADQAVLNGAPTFLVPVHHTGGYDIVVDRPDAWEHTVSALPDRDGVLKAQDYDQLVDSPILVGNPNLETFEVQGVEHVLVDLPVAPGWDSKKAAEGLRKVVEQEARFWRKLPYDRYLFLNWIAEGRGGLEHANSTLMMTKRAATSDEEAFQRWLGLAAHEHFHAWNAKRLHPVGLGPFDYENEVYTPDLWIVEGFTSYYDDLLLARAGLLTQTDYLGRISSSLESLQATPGRTVHPLSQASRDAWVKHYRPDENSPNSAVSYYLKGSLVAWLLDAKIRQVTGDERSLDDVLRLAYDRFSGDPGFTSAAFRELVDEVAGVPMGDDLTRWVDSTEELDLTPALQHFGLSLLPPDTKPGAWLGIRLSKGTITRVRRDGPAWAADLAVGDEILAIGDRRLTPDLTALLTAFEPGERVTVLVSRKGLLREVPVVLASRPHPPELHLLDGTRRQQKSRNAWLTGD